MKIGAQAELAALHYLRQQGLQLVAQNYRCRFGEIDLILREGEILVFAEVRLRKSNHFGGAAASIDIRKQRKLICTAQFYLATLARTPICRFDAVLLRSVPAQDILSKPGMQNSQHELENLEIEWIKNAFGA